MSFVGFMVMSVIVLLANMRIYDYGKVSKSEKDKFTNYVDHSVDYSIVVTIIEIGAIWCLSIM